MQSAAAAIDLHGDAGDLDGALAVHDAAVATMTVALGDAGVPGPDPADRPAARPARRRCSPGWSRNGGSALLELAERLAAEAEESTDAGRHRVPGSEGQAWLQRVRAERLRLRWLAAQPTDADELCSAWSSSVDGLRGVRARVRDRPLPGPAGRRAAGDRAGGRSRRGRRGRPGGRPASLGARPLLDEVRPLVGRAEAAGRRRRRAHPAGGGGARRWSPRG